MVDEGSAAIFPRQGKLGVGALMALVVGSMVGGGSSVSPRTWLRRPGLLVSSSRGL